MSDFGEAAGAGLEGAALARAVEPPHGESKAQARTSSPTCANCEALLDGPYCHCCGQRRDFHRTLTAIGHDLVHGVLHLDGKVFNTLPLLAFRPGRLTRRYIEGERARFVSPMAMFLFSVFAMFAVFQIVGIAPPNDLSFGDEGRASLAEAQQTWVAEYEERARTIERIPENSPEREAAEQALAEAQTNVRELRALRGLVGGEDAELAGGDDAVAGNAGRDLRDIPWIATLVDKWTENPSLMLYKMQANGYKFSWLLIPLSIPFVWLLFVWRRQFKAYDHAVFVTYSLAFMSLLFIVTSLIAVSPLGDDWAFAIFVVAAPLHIYKHLKHAYGLSRLSSIWRFVALFIFILMVLFLFLQALLVLGAF
jgi:hypothetical protein